MGMFSDVISSLLTSIESALLLKRGSTLIPRLASASVCPTPQELLAELEYSHDEMRGIFKT